MEMEDKKTELSPEKQQEKKMKNLISLSILLAGLFVGSLFVDVAQLVRGGGFSQKILNRSDVFSLDGRTWVAYDEPLVKIQVLTDDACQECQPDEAILGLKREMPTVLTEKVDVNTEEGKQLLEKFGVRTIPAFIFSKNIEETTLFAQASQVFEKKDNKYLLDSAAVGLPVGKYTVTPEITDQDIVIGSRDAKVKIVEFSDFQCPYCKQMHESVISPMLKEYGDKIAYVYKHLPLDFHAQAQNAALAGSCAHEQGKFVAYADKLFAEQAQWGATTGTQSFKNYARQLGLDSAQFNQCLEKYEEKVNSDVAQVQQFGVAGTPGTFVNNQFKNGVVPYESFKASIDEELAK